MTISGQLTEDIAEDIPLDIAIISDTHLPRGSRALPEACAERLRAADLIIHAGDFSQLEVLEELKEFGPVIAVYGNTDDALSTGGAARERGGPGGRRPQAGGRSTTPAPPRVGSGD